MIIPLFRKTNPIIIRLCYQWLPTDGIMESSLGIIDLTRKAWRATKQSPKTREQNSIKKCIDMYTCMYIYIHVYCYVYTYIYIFTCVHYIHFRPEYMALIVSLHSVVSPQMLPCCHDSPRAISIHFLQKLTVDEGAAPSVGQWAVWTSGQTHHVFSVS